MGLHFNTHALFDIYYMGACAEICVRLYNNNKASPEFLLLVRIRNYGFFNQCLLWCYCAQYIQSIRAGFYHFSHVSSSLNAFHW